MRTSGLQPTVPEPFETPPRPCARTYVLVLVTMKSTLRHVCSYMAIFASVFDISFRARTFIRNVRRGGHNSDLAVTVLEVWARSVQCVARGKPFKLFWPRAWIRLMADFRIKAGIFASPIPVRGFTLRT